MILADSNVWLAPSLPAHWWIRAPSRSAGPRSSHSLRLLTSAAVLAPYGNQPLTNSQAWDAYEALLADEGITFAAEEPQGIATLWRDYGARSTSSPKLWMDAYLAAFAVGAGCRLATTDTAFRQFHGLDVLVLR